MTTSSEGRPTSIGVIGIGAMGMAVAMRLLDTGFRVLVRDTRPQAEAEARAAGAIVCRTPAELAARADAVITLVVDAAQTEEVVCGPDGAAQALPPDATLLMCSTVQPAFAEALGQRLRMMGRTMMDAPCSGGPARARSGAMSMMLAGPRSALDACTPLLEIIAGTLFYIGERHGDGARAKVVNNMLAGVNLVAACEGMVLGMKLGLEPRQLFDIVQASSGASWVCGDRIPRVLAGDYTPKAKLDILKKDLSVLIDAARQAGFPVPMAEAAREMFARASALGLGTLDDAALAQAYAVWNRVELPGR